MKMMLPKIKQFNLSSSAGFIQSCCSLNNGCSESTLSVRLCTPAVTENDFQQLDRINWLGCWAEGDI